MKIKIILLILLFFTTELFCKVVPLKDFAQKSQIKSLRISPNGKNVAYTYEKGNEVKLAIMNLESKKGLYTFDVGDNREVVQFWWANDNRIGVLGGDRTGWLDGAAKHYELAAVDIDGKKRKLLWDFQRSSLQLVSLNRADDNFVLVNKSHFTDKGNAKLFRLNINNGKLIYLADTPKPTGGKDSVISGIYVDLKDDARVAIEYDPKDENDFYDDTIKLHLKNSSDFWEVLDLPKTGKHQQNISNIGFNSDNSIFYFSSDYDLSEGGTMGLFSYDFNSKKITKLFRDPDVNINGAIKDSNGAVIGVSYDAGYRKYYYVENEDAQQEIKFHKSIRASFKNQNINFMNYSQDGTLATLRVNSDRNPGDFYIFNRTNNKVTYLASSMPSINPKDMASVEPFTLVARDGLKMYGQMTIPPGKKLNNLPMVIYPHGGPYGARDRWGWSNTTAFSKQGLFGSTIRL